MMHARRSFLKALCAAPLAIPAAAMAMGKPDPLALVLGDTGAAIGKQYEIDAFGANEATVARITKQMAPRPNKEEIKKLLRGYEQLLSIPDASSQETGSFLFEDNTILA